MSLIVVVCWHTKNDRSNLPMRLLVQRARKSPGLELSQRSALLPSGHTLSLLCAVVPESQKLAIPMARANPPGIEAAVDAIGPPEGLQSKSTVVLAAHARSIGLEQQQPRISAVLAVYTIYHKAEYWLHGPVAVHGSRHAGPSESSWLLKETVSKVLACDLEGSSCLYSVLLGGHALEDCWILSSVSTMPAYACDTLKPGLLLKFRETVATTVNRTGGKVCWYQGHRVAAVFDSYEVATACAEEAQKEIS
eukprot:s1370_g13.t1